MQTAVVGHVEWIEFARVEKVPRRGEIVHAISVWEGPGGGGSVAAVQLAKLGQNTPFFTSLGTDDLGRLAARELEALGLSLRVSWGDHATRRGFTHVDRQGERTITVIGERLGPRGADDLSWDTLRATDATYFTAGDQEALRHARSSRVLVATSRALEALRPAGIRLDALVGSASDPDEAFEVGTLDPPPELVVMTTGATGGWYQTPTGRPRRFQAPPIPGPVVDRYGAGDSFAAGLTHALGTGASGSDAVAFAARCGAAALTGTAPFGGQLTEGPNDPSD